MGTPYRLAIPTQRHTMTPPPSASFESMGPREAGTTPPDSHGHTDHAPPSRRSHRCQRRGTKVAIERHVMGRDEAGKGSGRWGRGRWSKAERGRGKLVPMGGGGDVWEPSEEGGSGWAVSDQRGCGR
ncbi:hypothetical protein GUJ93_ZPchr0013g35803 [Zizania palustris]|uniref:Uncharacterized protein n=1 Tax=Zizania palustris TaxID=103762 RepID=A0A8J5WUQ3_ZIZPA|nr:hypothetical protein GUJ93_ZPchr0013g35803 [Zizania palustris]